MNRYRDTQGEQCIKTEAETGGMQPQVEEDQGLIATTRSQEEARKDRIQSQRWQIHADILAFLAFRTLKEYICCFKLCSLWYLVKAVLVN